MAKFYSLVEIQNRVKVWDLVDEMIEKAQAVIQSGGSFAGKTDDGYGSSYSNETLVPHIKIARPECYSVHAVEVLRLPEAKEACVRVGIVRVAPNPKNFHLGIGLKAGNWDTDMVTKDMPRGVLIWFEFTVPTWIGKTGNRLFIAGMSSVLERVGFDFDVPPTEAELEAKRKAEEKADRERKKLQREREKAEKEASKKKTTRSSRSRR